MRMVSLKTSWEAAVGLEDRAVGTFGIEGQNRRETIAVAFEY
jgi:hypothetical protein